MIITLRNNRSLLRKTNPFRKKSYFENREYFEKHSAGITLKHASQEQLRTIKDRIVSHRRRELYQVVVVIALVLIGVASLGVYLEGFNLALAPNQEIILSPKKMEENYQFYLKDGSNWLRNRNYQNAVSQYRKAKLIHSDSFIVNFQLAQALTYQCEFENGGCEEALYLLDSLIVEHPHKLKLFALKSICYISKGDSINLNKNYKILKESESWK
jgi:hypothetical protein